MLGMIVMGDGRGDVTIAAMMDAGMDVARLNTSHGTPEDHLAMAALYGPQSVLRRTSMDRDGPCPLPLPWSSRILARQSSQPWTVLPSPMSFTTGVGSRAGDDEHPEPVVRGTRIGGENASPLRVIPEVGQVSENGTQCPQSRLAADVSHTPRARFHIAIGSTAE